MKARNNFIQISYVKIITISYKIQQIHWRRDMKNNNSTILCYHGSLRNEDFNQNEINELFNFAHNELQIKQSWLTANLPLEDVNHLARKLQNDEVKTVIIAGQNPGFIKPMFVRAMKQAGKEPDNISLASFNEYRLNGSLDLNMAKAVLKSIFLHQELPEIMESEEKMRSKDTLVIGAGIAGIQASLEIANGNEKVYLIEKSGTIGGHMAMFDKTFPTLDCAACILTPKMVDVGQHPMIDLRTNSTVVDVSGSPGDFTVRIHAKARMIDLVSCIGCGTCAEKCPVKVPSEFDHGTALRKAAYIPFPQAVPNKYLIDSDNCRYVQEDKCGVCMKVCPVPDCIDLDAKDEEFDLQVGNIIVATGFKAFDAGRLKRYGYGRFPNVLTSLELERLINAAGPTGGEIVQRTQDKKGNWIFEKDSPVPKSVALIHCVGSRDQNHNHYCSKVCCMYSLKLAHLVKEKLPDTEVTEYYIDMRAYGKGYEEFYNRIGEEGIRMIRGKTATIKEKGENLCLRSEDIEGARLIEQEVEMVVLAVGLEPNDDAGTMANILGLSCDDYGWYNEMNYVSNPTSTYSGGVSIAGVCQGPKDIPDSVAQASAAASKVMQSIMKGKVKKVNKKVSLEQIKEIILETEEVK
jgi:heterodisulfide reductase subunit A2